MGGGGGVKLITANYFTALKSTIFLINCGTGTGRIIVMLGFSCDFLSRCSKELESGKNEVFNPLLKIKAHCLGYLWYNKKGFLSIWCKIVYARVIQRFGMFTRRRCTCSPDNDSCSLSSCHPSQSPPPPAFPSPSPS